jgi:hypothetical protein
MKRFIAALLLAASAAANAGTGALVDVTVRDLDTGRVLPLYPQSGRWYVPGEAGHRYAVALENRTGERVLAVLSVDGVNAISGQTASAQQTGYVLAPWQRTEVRGWRKSMGEVAEFYFTDLPDSYAARTGRPRNVGVIGVAVFRENVPPPPAHEPEISLSDRDDRYYSRERSAAESSAPAPALGQSAGAPAGRAKSHSPAEARRQDLGTGHGQRRYDPASYTAFERRSSTPDEVIAVHYDDVRALVDRGIVPRHHWYQRPAPREPDPFPVGFAPDPYR